MVASLAAPSAPSMFPWTDEIQNAYSDYELFQVYRQELLDAPRASLDLARLGQLSVIYALDGDFGAALQVFEHLDFGSIENPRRVAFYRYAALLNVKVGAVTEAIKYYDLALVDASDAVPALEQEIQLDLINLNDDLVEKGRLFDQLKERRSKDWLELNPGFDYAVRQFHSSLLNEEFDDQLKGEYSHRISRSLATAATWSYAAQALAFSIGDMIDADNARREFARAISLNAIRTTDYSLLCNALEGLIEARDDSGLESLLGDVAPQVASLLPIDNLVLTLRPREQHGIPAERIWRTVLTLIKSFSDYLKDETRRALNEEMFNSLLLALDGGEVPLVFSVVRSPYEFIETLSSLDSLTSTQLEILVGKLKGHHIAKRVSYWSLVVSHSWSEDNLTAAQKVVEIITCKPFEEYEEPSDPIDVLAPIAEKFPTLSSIILNWMLCSPDRVGRTLSWRGFVEKRYPQLAPYVHSWVQALVEHQVARLRSTRESDPIRVHSFRAEYLLPATIKAYPDSFSEQDIDLYISQLVDALGNPYIAVEDKQNYLAVLGSLLEMSEHPKKYEEFIKGSEAGLLRGRPLTSPLSLVHGAGEELLRIRLIDIKTAEQIGPSESDLTALAQCANGEVSFTRRIALEVLGNTIKRGFCQDQLSALQYSKLFDGVYQVRAQAVATIFYSGAYRTTFGDAILSRILDMSRTDHPYVVINVLGWARQAFPLMEEAWRERFAGMAAFLEHHANRHIRRWASKFLGATPTESHSADPE